MDQQTGVSPAPQSRTRGRCAHQIWWTASSVWPAPNMLLVADFTYVKLIAEVFIYVAFVIDAYAGAIVGWEASASKYTRFVESAIHQAAALRRPARPSPRRRYPPQ